MTFHSDDLIKFGIVSVVAILTYVFFWKKNRALAVIILLGLVGYLSYYTVNWKYLQTYFFVDWGSGGIAN